MYNFIKKYFWPILIALFFGLGFLSAATARADFQRDTEMSVQYNPETETLYLSGQTTMAQVFGAAIWLTGDNKASTVVMEGPGGLLDAGLMLGRMIDKSGATVRIDEGTRCVSACAFAAMGSDYVDIDGDLWLHTFYAPYVPTTINLMEIGQFHQEGTHKLMEYMMKQGYSNTLAQYLFSKTDYCNFLVVSDSEALKGLKYDTTNFTKFFENRYSFLRDNTTTISTCK